MFVREKRVGGKSYLQIVENSWVDGTVRQRVVHSLGRLDVLRERGELEGLVVSAGRFCEKVAVLSAHDKGQSLVTRTRRIGPGLVFDRLRRDLGIGRAVEDLVSGRKFGFAMERAVFLTVLHRLFASGSDRAAEVWKEDYEIAGARVLELHHLYRAMAWLGEPLGEERRYGSPRCVKDEIEEKLFGMRRDLFSNLDLVFFDTTSIHFEGEGGETLGRYGHSKDHRPDLKQMVVGVVLDDAGRPICSELVPGNTADVTALVPVVERLRREFSVNEVCVVADRGMVSKETVARLESCAGMRYILGARMRSTSEVTEEVLGRPGRYQEVHRRSAHERAPSPLKVKEVVVRGRRYIVCLNEDQAEKDRRDREAIVELLREALKRGDKSLIGNRGYRRYVRASGTRFTVDTERIEDEARYDGKWVLTTNTGLPAGECALKYKQLWMVEAMFRSLKSLLETRPIYHRCDAAIRGHVFCSFLALVLRKEVQDRLEANGWRLEWADIMRDLDNLLETQIEINGKRYILRSEVKGTVGKVAQSCGVALPPVLRECGPPKKLGTRPFCES